MGNVTSLYYGNTGDQERDLSQPSVAYLHKGFKYVAGFPKEWLDHKHGTGPAMCENCQEYGSFNGIFLGYCTTCAREYGGERGNGFYAPLMEENFAKETSAYRTYLKGVPIDGLIFAKKFEEYHKELTPMPHEGYHFVESFTEQGQEKEQVQEQEQETEFGEELHVQQVQQDEARSSLDVPVKDTGVRRVSSGIFTNVPVPEMSGNKYVTLITPKGPPSPCKHCGGDHWNRSCPIKYPVDVSICN